MLHRVENILSRIEANQSHASTVAAGIGSLPGERFFPFPWQVSSAVLSQHHLG
jgi:hypothetical protein